MRRFIGPGRPALVFLCLFALTPFASGQTPHSVANTYFFCESGVAPNAATYIGPIQRMDTDAFNRAQADIAKSFGEFLTKKYGGFAGSASCMSNPHQNWLQSYRANRIQTLRDRGFRPVETDWSYAPLAASPAD